jgi:cytochrome c6
MAVPYLRHGKIFKQERPNASSMSPVHRFFILLPVLPLLILLSCESAETKIARNAERPKNNQNSATNNPDGMFIFRKNCAVCHGADGKLGLNGAKDLTISTIPLPERIDLITNGRKLMTPFKTVLSPEEIKAVAEYTLSLK